MELQGEAVLPMLDDRDVLDADEEELLLLLLLVVAVVDCSIGEAIGSAGCGACLRA